MYGGQEYNEDFLTKMYKNSKIDPETGRRVKTYKTLEEATVAAKRRSSRLKQGGFNPEGSGYDYKRAKELNYKKDEKASLPHVSQSLKFGGMGCPHREIGVKSDIQGVKDIQVKGKSFKGVL